MAEAVADQLDLLLENAPGQIREASDEKTLEDLRVSLLGKKGNLTFILRNLGTLPPSERPLIGKKANEIKEKIEQLLDERLQNLRQASLQDKLQKEWLDFTLPGETAVQGRLHPLTLIKRETKEIFRALGFEVVCGPEVESEYYNFEALNIPADHPAREMWDSLYLDEKTLLRTHTSPVQIRVMEKRKPPLRVVSDGKCYRRDAVDATHSFQFHQMEGFMVDEQVSFAELKGVLSTFARLIFGTDRQVRFVPSYFPFTEPSVEVLIDCFNCAKKTSEETSSRCKICGGEKWLEILGAGMIHPNVLRVVNYPPHYSGFAFGLGLERIAMLKYGIDDIRLFYENDFRFLKQF